MTLSKKGIVVTGQVVWTFESVGLIPQPLMSVTQKLNMNIGFKTNYNSKKARVEQILDSKINILSQMRS